VGRVLSADVGDLSTSRKACRGLLYCQEGKMVAPILSIPSRNSEEGGPVRLGG